MNQRKNNINIVFFGTGKTSFEALEYLYNKYAIKLVITKDIRTKNKGQTVYSWAQENNINCITPKNSQDLYKYFSDDNTKWGLGVVLDYGMIIPEKVINKFKHGIINSHFSLLPKYRGSNPIRAAILNQDKLTGITIIKITPRLDDGAILAWSEIEIGEMNAIELRDKLSELNCTTLSNTIDLYLNDELQPIDQNEDEATYTQKTAKVDGIINPAKKASRLLAEIRAYAGWPGSILSYNGADYIVHEAIKVNTKIDIDKGELKILDKKLYYGCSDGSIEITKIQPLGKNILQVDQFINGYKNKISS